MELHIYVFLICINIELKISLLGYYAVFIGNLLPAFWRACHFICWVEQIECVSWENQLYYTGKEQVQ